MYLLKQKLKTIYINCLVFAVCWSRLINNYEIIERENNSQYCYSFETVFYIYLRLKKYSQFYIQARQIDYPINSQISKICPNCSPGGLIFISLFRLAKWWWTFIILNLNKRKNNNEQTRHIDSVFFYLWLVCSWL